MADEGGGDEMLGSTTENIGSERDKSAADTIPVCNLFNNPTAEVDNAQLTTNQQTAHLATNQQSNFQRNVSEQPYSAHLSTPSHDNQGGSTSQQEPTLCDVFKNNDTSAEGDDIFSHLGDSLREPTSVAQRQLKEAGFDSNTSFGTMESLRLNQSVESFTIGELNEKETTTETEPPPEKNTFDSDANQTFVDSDSEPTQKPMLSSPSFVSVTSFSISPDEQNDQPTLDDEASRLEKLSLEEPRAHFDIGSSETNITEVDKDISVDESANVNEPLSDNVNKNDQTTLESDAVQLPTPLEKEKIEKRDDVGINEVTELQIKPSENEQMPQKSEQLEHPTSISLFTSEIENSDKSGLFSSPADRQGIFTEEDDPFAAALSSSELDRRRDAWIPSQNTRSVLNAVISSQKSIKLETDRLTRPGLSTSEILEDPVKELVARMTGSETVLKRENLTMDDVHLSKDGIKQLIDTGNLRAAANLCAKLLTDLGQGFGQATQVTTNTPDTLQLWFTRIFILTRLKLFEMAATELSAFQDLDNPDLYYEFYPEIYPGRRGSMVSFSFRLLYAEFPRHVDKPEESLKRLHKVLAQCTKILCNLNEGKNEVGEASELKEKDREASIKFWTDRKVKALFSIGNTLMQLKDYVLAVDVFDRILKIKPEKTVELQSGIGRIFLHMGDVRSAQLRFAEAEKAGVNLPKYKVQLILNRGFMYIGTNNWQEAHAQFELALKVVPHNIVVLNNKAVCLLYLGRLKDAIAVLEEGTFDENTFKKGNDLCWQQVMTQGLLSNLTTLYELESSRYVMKKRTLFLKHIAQSCGDSFDTACLKEI